MKAEADATQIEADVRGWDAIVEHRTGTAGDEATSDWLAGQIASAGVAPELDRFPFLRRVPGLCQVSDGTERAGGLPLFDGSTTPDEGITGSAGPLGSSADIGVTLFGPSPAHPGSRELAAARKEGRHRAIIAVAAADGVAPGLAVQNAESFKNPFGPPVLQVSSTAADWLLAARNRGADLSVHAELTEVRTFASNVQCLIEGRRADLAPLVVMTPKSAWWTCTAERAGGISLWLQIIRRFAADRPERNVLFTANTGHELGHLGLDHYLSTHPGLISKAHAWIHLGANFAARDSSVLYQASSERWMETGLSTIREAGIPEVRVTPVGERPLGEAANIHDGGGRYVSLLGSNSWFHHPDDRWPASVDIARLNALSGALLKTAVRLSGA